MPHFCGGTLAGRVVVDGRDTREHRPRDLADVVGFVGQDPLSGFVTDTVEDELAYGMESLGLPADVMRKRVEETLDLLGLADMRHRPLASLSGGQQQRVAIGSVLTTHPRVLVLDEPTSALDPIAAEEVLATLQRLVHDLGLTVVLAEHRLERVVQYADRVVLVPGGGRPVVSGTPEQVLQDSPVAPPVVELGRVAGWTPLPLSVRDARRKAGPLREQLTGGRRPGPRAPTRRRGRRRRPSTCVASYGHGPRAPGRQHHDRARGEVVALMGRNGAGKSTLLKTLVGMKVRHRRHRPRRRPGAGRRTPQPAAAPRRPGAAGARRPAVRRHRRRRVRAGRPGLRRPGRAPRSRCSTRLSPGVPVDQHPRDLSEGQRLTLALAIVLAARPPLVLLDEPTRGLDYTAKHRLVEILRDLVADGHAVLLATHDVELVAEVATRVLVIADGELVADGPTATWWSPRRRSRRRSPRCSRRSAG